MWGSKRNKFLEEYNRKLGYEIYVYFDEIEMDIQGDYKKCLKRIKSF